MKKRAIGIIGLNHNTAPLEVREKFYIKEGSIPDILARIQQEGINEAVVLSTCNRTEIYYSGDNNDAMVKKIRHVLSDAVKAGADVFDRYTSAPGRRASPPFSRCLRARYDGHRRTEIFGAGERGVPNRASLSKTTGFF